jgi:hypothetical protein
MYTFIEIIFEHQISQDMLFGQGQLCNGYGMLLLLSVSSLIYLCLDV